MMKLERARAKDKSIAGTTLGHKWRYSPDKGVLEVPENVGRAILAGGGFIELRPEPKAQTKKTYGRMDTTADGIMVIDKDVNPFIEDKP